MSKLSLALEAILSQIHWPPAHKSFHEAVVAEFDALSARCEALEKKFEAVFPTPRPAPVYLAEPVALPVVAVMPADAAEAGADTLDESTGFTTDHSPQGDAAAAGTYNSGESENHSTDTDTGASGAPAQDPAAQAITGTPLNLLAPQPDPAAAGPDATPDPAV